MVHLSELNLVNCGKGCSLQMTINEKIKILIVDDRPENLFAIEAIFIKAHRKQARKSYLYLLE